MRLIKILALMLILVTASFCKNKKEQASSVNTPNRNLQKLDPVTTQASAPAIGLNLGNAAPEISQKNPAGVNVNLSSLKGQVVLIDFWASWCGPCRFENPTVVKAYKLYKDKKLRGGKGFTVYSVSLDMDVNAWKKAIEKDSLAWENHVSDLKGWANEAAAKYGVSGIPMNFLINENGIIINKNLRGKDLLNALDVLAK